MSEDMVWRAALRTGSGSLGWCELQLVDGRSLWGFGRLFGAWVELARLPGAPAVLIPVGSIVALFPQDGPRGDSVDVPLCGRLEVVHG